MTIDREMGDAPCSGIPTTIHLHTQDNTFRVYTRIHKTPNHLRPEANTLQSTKSREAPYTSSVVSTLVMLEQQGLPKMFGP